MHFTIISCGSCGWQSNEMDQNEMKSLGVPWYCDRCGNRVFQYITFERHERETALNKIIRNKQTKDIVQ